MKKWQYQRLVEVVRSDVQRWGGGAGVQRWCPSMRLDACLCPAPAPLRWAHPTPVHASQGCVRCTHLTAHCLPALAAAVLAG